MMECAQLPEVRAHRMAIKDPAAFYQQLGNLVATMPDLNTTAYCSPEGRQWLGRVAILVQEGGDVMDFAQFKVAADNLGSPATLPGGVSVHGDAVNKITSILYRTLARAEQDAPVAAQGTFIPVGASFTAIDAVSKILGTAASSVLIVDPYADGNLLSDFAVLAPEGVQLMVLSDKAGHKAGLKPMAASWAKQYGTVRPLEVRLAAAGSIHDRLIIIDNQNAWIVGQSFNALAKRAPTSMMRADSATAQMKVSAYGTAWKAADLLV